MLRSLLPLSHLLNSKYYSDTSQHSSSALKLISTLKLKSVHDSSLQEIKCINTERSWGIYQRHKAFFSRTWKQTLHSISFWNQHLIVKSKSTLFETRSSGEQLNKSAQLWRSRIRKEVRKKKSLILRSNQFKLWMQREPKTLIRLIVRIVSLETRLSFWSQIFCYL